MLEEQTFKRDETFVLECGPDFMAFSWFLSRFKASVLAPVFASLYDGGVSGFREVVVPPLIEGGK